MDTRKIFRGISRKLLEDFDISSQIHHKGVKGTYRESALKDFLEKGRLPKKYGIGSGEIIGRTRNVSRQSDLIIFDSNEGISLIFGDSIQVYPIESVHGVIEVKSTLNKQELLASLENVKSVKMLSPEDTVSTPLAAGWNMAFRRPRPFGIVFAYQLGSNSLASLEANLKEWEKENPKELWPNAVVVLDEGIIFHMHKFRKGFTNDEIMKSAHTIAIHYKADTLFRFYSVLLELCSNSKVGPVEIDKYFEPAEQVGEYVVENHNRVTRKGEDCVYMFKYEFIDKIVKHCKKQGTMSNRELFLKQFGQIPVGMEEDYLNQEVYLYNPKNLLGTHEVDEPFTKVDGFVCSAENVMVPCHYLRVDNETYYFPWAYAQPDDFEEIPGKTKDDL